LIIGYHYVSITCFSFFLITEANNGLNEDNPKLILSRGSKAV